MPSKLVAFFFQDNILYSIFSFSHLHLPGMTYAETISYLFSRLPMFSRIGQAAYNKDLTNTIRLCEFLGDPQKKLKTIHIAGTNGKGSVSHMLASVLQTAGYKTGLYTSPHLKDFRERIKLNGEMCSKEFIVAFTEKIRAAIDAINPSFFEITVAMAFDFFVQEKVDIAVIETGLGGRFDSTNVITPLLSIITNIGLDHVTILGDTLEKIAFEKAGIIKENVPVIVGQTLPETSPVFENVAADKNAELIFASENRKAISWSWQKHELITEIEEKNKTDHSFYHLDLPGLYQTKNLVTALESCHQLNKLGLTIDEEIIKKGLQHTKKITGLHGRWEIVHQHPTIVLDVAHNEDGVKQIMEQVEITEHDHLHIVLGMVKDKEIEQVLSLFPKLAEYYFTQAPIPRALDAKTLEEKAASFNLKGSVYPNVDSALAIALAKAKKEDLILVCGSVFLVGEVNID